MWGIISSSDIEFGRHNKMNDESRTKEQLIKELVELRRLIADLEKSETESKREEEELRRTRAIFQGLFEFSPDAIVVVNRDGRIVQINTQAERMFGYSRDEVLNKPVEIFVPERFRELHIEQRKNYMSRPHVRYLGEGLELYGRKKDGSEFDVDITLGPLETEEGIIVLSIIRDITEHKRMEEALRKSEEKYRSIFENAVEGIFQISTEGRILTANPAFARMLGHGSPDELIAAVPDFRKLFIEPGCRLEFMHSIRTSGALTDFEAQVRHKDGSKIWILINARGINDAGGKLIGFEGMARDITSHKRAERNFQMLIESGPDAIVAIDNKFEILIVNTQTERMFGYQREELLGKSYDMLIPERFREEHAKNCAAYFTLPSTKMMAVHLAPVALRKDGSEFPVEINMSPIETESGIIIVNAIRDVTGKIK